MFFAIEKLEKRIQELESFRYRDMLELESILVKESVEEVPNPPVPTDFKEFRKEKTGMLWKGWDKYLWLHLETFIPEEWKYKKILGLFDFGKTGEGNNSGFESLLYLDGRPYQGVDSNHKEVFFPQDYAGKKIKLTFRLWSGMEGGGIPTEQEHKIKRAAVAWLDQQTDDLYYLSKMILETIKELAEENTVRYALLRALNTAFLKIDWSCEKNERFYASVNEADAYLNQAIDQMEHKSEITINCVGHTHIDLAWLWRLKHTREKASRSFSTVLRLMENFEEYLFLQTQPQIYEYIKEDFPELFEAIREKVREGKWEADGAMWVEADCNLISGESLTRQILLGSRFFREEFGREVEYLWLPDVFGYSWALPQILKKSGIHTFMTTKISWNEYNRIPHDTFFWRGLDGSEVLTHFITTPEETSAGKTWFTYNGLLTPYTVNGIWKKYQDKNLNQELLLAYGFGDGGGGVNRDALEQRRRLEKIPGLPQVKTSTAGQYFRRLQATIKNTEEYVHTWDGELYLEFHRGTYTSHAYNKNMNRRMEFLYREAEWLAAMAANAQGRQSDAEQGRLTEGWKIVLRNQFHDIIPGSSIFPVYEDSKKEYAMAQQIAEEIEQDAFTVLTEKQKDAWSVINDACWERGQIVPIEETRTGIFRNDAGEILDTQKEENFTYVKVDHVPPMSAMTIHFEEKARREDNASIVCKTISETQKPGRFEISEKRIETPFYSICLNQAGQLSGLYDKENDREVIAEGKCANVFQVFEDKPRDFDAWNIDIFYQEKMQEIKELASFQILENGYLRAVVRLEWRYGKSRIIQDMTLYGDSRRIDFVTWVDWHETHQLLKAAFELDIRTTEARYDIQYGNVKRANNWNTGWEMAKFETVAHRWVDMSEYDYGVSLLNDCKYGHDVKDNRMRITLIKSATNPDYRQDQGIHRFTYALYPHKGGFVQARIVPEAFALNQPMKLIPGSFKDAETSFVAFDTEHIELDAVKCSEDGNYLVVRFHDYTGSRKKVAIHTVFPVASWCEADLMERPLEPFRKSDRIKVEVKPYEIKTLLLSTK